MSRMLWILPLGMLALLGLSGCAAPGSKNTTAEAIKHEMVAATRDSAKPIKTEAISNALLPPLSMMIPKTDSKPLEPRFDLAVNNTPASQVFMAIVSGTRYNMLVPTEISGNISLSLKDVTVFEALEAIRELYGFEYKVDGTRIYIQPIALQTRLFQVSYLTAQRTGSSTLSVQSASDGAGSTGTTGTTGAAGSTGATGSTGTAGSAGGSRSSYVTTTTNAKANNFWGELEESLKAIVGNEHGRTVVINSMSGVIVVRAMPDELKNVTAYLKASQISIERQVILEAKILEVQLNDSFQAGVNWAAFGSLKSSPSSNGSFGVLTPGTSLASTGALTDGTLTATAGSSLSSASTAAGGLFGLAFQSTNFAAMLDFLETQGSVHVLSSPRIATLNNQKAILKVGTDEYFITGITTTPATTFGTTTTPGTVTPNYSSMFSGIALDVTPSINEYNEIILHVHPSVSQITAQNVPMLASLGGGTIPMALTAISETDSVVHARDGQIVVIGGLMTQSTTNNQSGLPGLSTTALGLTQKSTQKSELILLLKPTVVDSDRDWSDDIAHSRNRMNSMANAPGAKP
jgi:MSHA biogenesis protein MshL